MNVLTVVILAFSVLGAIDWLIGNKFGLGKEFEKGFSLFGSMTLSMLGMIVLAPAIGVWLTPVFEGFYDLFKIDPSVLPSMLLANDMGGMQLSQTICKDQAIGNYNALVTSSMMGCVVSFTIPFALSLVKKERYNDLFFGLLCGIATIPVGCFVAGLCCGLNPLAVLLNLLPILVISAIVGVALVLLPKICIKCFTVFGYFVKAVSVVGLVCAVFTFLTKVEICPYFDTLENAAFVCVNACITLSGTLPMMFVVSRLLDKPFRKLGALTGINTVSAVSFLSSLVTNASTFSVMDQMDEKGTVLNAAFAVSASFTFGGHLALTLAYNAAYVLPMIVGKLVSGVCGLLLALLLYKRPNGTEKKNDATVETPSAQNAVLENE